MWDLIVSVPYHCLSFYFAVFYHDKTALVHSLPHLIFHTFGAFTSRCQQPILIKAKKVKDK